MLSSDCAIYITYQIDLAIAAAIFFSSYTSISLLSIQQLEKNAHI